MQIGAALGSWSGGLTHASRWQRATLVAAGGSAGIAATFNTPLGGLLFAVEILLHEVSVRTLVPVALATTTATWVGQGLFGNVPAFPIPATTEPVGLETLPAFVVLGAVTAVASALFIRTLYGAEDLFDGRIPSPYLRHILGMLILGALFTTLHEGSGHYYVQGVGYAAIVDVLTSAPSVGFLLLLFVLKLLATALTLGSGGSGGVFSPSLFMGAMLGAVVGIAMSALVAEVSIVPFVLAGMAGMIAGTTGAVLTAIVMMFEMTLQYSPVLPMALTATVSYGLRRAMLADSIHTTKLSRRGHVMPEALQANAYLLHHISDLKLSPAEDGPVNAVPATPTDTLFDVLGRLQRAGASAAVVTDGDAVLGAVTKADLAEAIAEGMEMFED